MKQLLHLSIMVCVCLSLFGCVKLNRKASTKFKKKLVSDGGNWEITKENGYYINNGIDLVYETYDGVVGVYHFSKDEGSNPLPSTEGGSWTPTNGATESILYRVSTDDQDDETITLETFIRESGSWVLQEEYEALPGHTSENMTWINTSSIYVTAMPDTTIKHTYYARKI